MLRRRWCGGSFQFDLFGLFLHLLSADQVSPPVEDDDTVVAVLHDGSTLACLPVAGVVDLRGPLLVGQQVAGSSLQIVLGQSNPRKWAI